MEGVRKGRKRERKGRESSRRKRQGRKRELRKREREGRLTLAQPLPLAFVGASDKGAGKEKGKGGTHLPPPTSQSAKGRGKLEQRRESKGKS
jgi:hypothetical protein